MENYRQQEEKRTRKEGKKIKSVRDKTKTTLPL